MKNLSLLFIIGIILASCTKTTDGEWMVFEEAVCLPFWTNENSNKKSIENLEKYLKVEGIIPLRIKIKGERTIPECESCDCKTGITYEVEVDETQSGLMLYYGFKTR